MAPWLWYWKEADDEAYVGECDTREAAIAEARSELGPDAIFEIIEARMSEAARHEGSDITPFLRERNHEVISPSPQVGACADV